MDNRCLAIVERWLMSQGSGDGKDAVVSRSLEPVKASENGLYMLANWTGIVSQSAGNVTGAEGLNVVYILSEFSIGEPLFWCTPVCWSLTVSILRCIKRLLDPCFVGFFHFEISHDTCQWWIWGCLCDIWGHSLTTAVLAETQSPTCFFVFVRFVSWNAKTLVCEWNPATANWNLIVGFIRRQSLTLNGSSALIFRPWGWSLAGLSLLFGMPLHLGLWRARWH